MAYPIRFWALLLTGLLLYQFSSEAVGDQCKFEKNIDLTIDLSTANELQISAAAGDLDIIGVAGSTEAAIKGKVCVSKEAWLEESGLSTITGKQSKITVDLPSTDGNWSLFGSNYARMDLSIEVPQDLALEVKDSSGDMFLRNTAEVQIQDSSGDIEVENARATVVIRDSSGDIDVDRAEGDVTIVSDSSGDINANDINGSVLVMKDSSGDIDIRRVSDDVIVERDSSGDISANDVGGDFRVLKDGSGGIRSSNVEGEVQIPKNS
jgi:hypothetical protein